MSASSENPKVENAADRLLSFFRRNPAARLAPAFILHYIIPSFGDKDTAIKNLLAARTLQMGTDGLLSMTPETDTDLRFRFARALVFIDTLGGWERPDGVFEMKPANQPQPGAMP